MNHKSESFRRRFSDIMYDLEELRNDIKAEMDNLYKLINSSFNVPMMQVLQDEETDITRRQYRTRWLNTIRENDIFTIEDFVRHGRRYRNIGKKCYDYMNEKLSKYNIKI